MPAQKSKKKSMKLLVVESPTKAKTIKKYLGSGYDVVSCMGHIIDLPKSRLAVNVDKNFEPEYITVRGKGKILSQLKKKAKQAKTIYLAADNDREGEAISWHLKNVFSSITSENSIKRVVFNEITPPAIKQAIKEPGIISIPLVDAQKARRVLDRLVGYNISPILWAKVKNGLSAGRVQSVALRIICEREDEIDAFIPNEYWNINALLKKGRLNITASLFKINNKKPELHSKNQVDTLLSLLNNKDFTVSKINISNKTISPTPPFTTSKLQQTAANRLGFTSKKTMIIAQQLYEGINIKNSPIGLITYMRTDSTRISQSALTDLRTYITEKFPECLPDQPVYYKAGKGKIQDAHEAIRPTSVLREPEQIKEYLTVDQYKLYSIIWEKFVSSQMLPQHTESTSVEISCGLALFKANYSRVIFPGYQSVLNLLKEKKVHKNPPSLQEGETLTFVEWETSQHYTQPPPRYTDASIIKILEESGIGRPSTYASIISTLTSRYYITRTSRTLIPTTLGRVVNKILVANFPDILAIDFTANMEKNLDMVEQQKAIWNEVLHTFYTPFKQNIEKVNHTLENMKGHFDEATDIICDKCGQKMIKKLGRNGYFIACSAFPECRNTQSIPLADCPEENCDGKIITKKGLKKQSRKFYGCTKYPDCNFITWDIPTDIKCPKCNKFLVRKRNKEKGDYKACVDDKCGYILLKEVNSDTNAN